MLERSKTAREAIAVLNSVTSS